MKSATTASTQTAPALDEDSRLSGRREAGSYATFPERRAKLKHDGHLADVRVGADGEQHRLVQLAHTPRTDGKIGRGTAHVVNRRSRPAGDRGELRIVADEAVKAVPDIEAELQRAANDVAQRVGQSAGGEGDPNEQAVGAAAKTILDGAHDGNVSAVPEDVLRRAAGAARVEHGRDVRAE